MKLIQINDADLIKSIITDPELWERLKEDGLRSEDYEPSMTENAIYLGAYVGELLIGVFSYHKQNSSTINIHANILQKYRKQYAKEAGRLAIAYFAFDTHDTIQKLIAEIPVIYKDVYHFSLNNGLIKEGINRKSILKNGELVDTYMLGITKEEAIAIQLERAA